MFPAAGEAEDLKKMYSWLNRVHFWILIRDKLSLFDDDERYGRPLVYVGVPYPALYECRYVLVRNARQRNGGCFFPVASGGCRAADLFRCVDGSTSLCVFICVCERNDIHPLRQRARTIITWHALARPNYQFPRRQRGQTRCNGTRARAALWLGCVRSEGPWLTSRPRRSGISIDLGSVYYGVGAEAES